jgi:hypothetical protein
MKFGTKIYYKSTPTSDVVHLVYNSTVHTNFTTNQLQNVFVYYSMFLYVSAIHCGYLRRTTVLIDVNSVHGNLSSTTSRLYIVV